jgi:hypothetical protein
MLMPELTFIIDLCHPHSCAKNITEKMVSGFF